MLPKLLYIPCYGSTYAILNNNKACEHHANTHISVEWLLQWFDGNPNAMMMQ